MKLHLPDRSIVPVDERLRDAEIERVTDALRLFPVAEVEDFGNELRRIAKRRGLAPSTDGRPPA